MMIALTHFLLPLSISQLDQRQSEVARNVTARILNEGDFLHPTDGVTFYIRQIDDNGTLNDVFLSDRRDQDMTVTYTGAKAFLVRDGDQTHLIMVDGMAQRLHHKTRRLSTTAFSDFSYDISSLANKSENRSRNIRAIPSSELMHNRDAITSNEGHSLGAQVEELHLRFARAFVCIAVTLIGFSSLMLGNFSRFGVWKQALLAFVLLVVVEGLRGVVSEPVLQNPDLWPLIYLPTILGVGIALIFLHVSARPVGTWFTRLRRGTQQETAV